ncbi:efflux RND transporter periplasmic adaptor subunit [Marinifilum caeruleilacunae]|uniref:Efflux RND transporter periplasmic adaptor subunit n=1 Tax=Marinifilum caeruleilacunae TaxID=2499076 RepID=A0ABX1X203_9BACT|nr:efflux RND transporter periplasmic adaptor subunit [Marinifilum caeruleilacunae]NOU62123.1 efflux RND transporter periplasmic adaptor subunit [Marinifilum caeruleilacunae]
MKTYLSFFLLTLSIISCKETDKKLPAVKPVKYEKIDYSRGKQEQTFPGVVKAEYETKLSFKVGGTLNAVNIKLGQKIQKNQLLSSIDPIDYIVQAEQAKAEKRKAESQLVNARSVFERIEKLYENNSVSLNDYDDAKLGLASAESQFKAASKQLEAANNQVNYTKLYAPMDGIITQVNVESNESVGEGQIIAVMNSETDPEIEVGVPEVSINKLKKGKEVSIVLPSIPDQKFKGQIKKVGFASGASSTFPVVVSINTSKIEIRPGMAADVTFKLGNEDNEISPKIVAPFAAVGEDVSGNYVFVLKKASNSNYRVEKRTVQLGEILPEGFEVIKGLQKNELVAIAGLRFLQDNMEVCLLEN